MSTITGTDGSDNLPGTGGDDTIVGLGGDDIINGGAGSDTIQGGPGSDTLTGGTGPDIFKDTAAGLNGDRITDFLPGDRIQITDLPLASANIQIVGSTLTYNGGSIQIDNLGPGRFVLRDLGGTGVEIRLQETAHNDFNGDGRSDVLWRGDDGSVREWLGQSDGSLAGNIAHVNVNPGPSWHVAGTGDFNGDGREDILWRNDQGTIREWLGQSDGSFVGNIAHVDLTPDLGMQVAGIGDFNADGRSDILWRRDDGTITEWLGQAAGDFTANANVNVNPGTAWHVVGTGDFNGDGSDDILWRNDSGTVREWLGQPDGSFVGNIAHVDLNPSLSLHVAATGDFNGDGRSDILWHSDDGTVNEWLGQADGSFVNNANVNLNPGTDWHVAETGDFNGDAIDDILWRNDSGTVREWLGQANGSFVGNIAHVDVNPGLGWHVQDPFVHDLFV